MATIRDLVRFNIALCSETICELKNKALVTAEQGTRIVIGPQYLHRVTLDTYRGSAVPRHPAEKFHPEHRRYLGLKRECSIWLTALKILKTDNYEYRYDTIRRIQLGDGMYLQSYLTSLVAHCRGNRDLLDVAAARLVQVNETMTKGRREDTVWNNYGEPKQTKTKYHAIDWAWLDSWVREREQKIAEYRAKAKEAVAAND